MSRCVGTRSPARLRNTPAHGCTVHPLRGGVSAHHQRVCIGAASTSGLRGSRCREHACTRICCPPDSLLFRARASGSLDVPAQGTAAPSGPRPRTHTPPPAPGSLAGGLQAGQRVRQGVCVPDGQGHQEGNSQGGQGPGEGPGEGPGGSLWSVGHRASEATPQLTKGQGTDSVPATSPLTRPLTGRPAQVQKENYRQEKKRATRQLLSALTDPRVVIMADSLKVGATGVGRPGVHAARSTGPRRGRAKSPAAQRTGYHVCPRTSGPLSWSCPTNRPQAGGFKPQELIPCQAWAKVRN